jgi:CheY-like chemotaxis protein
MQDQLTAQLQPAAVHPRGQSVLIIDDDASIAEVLSERLHRQGFITHTAWCGKQGLNLARSLHPDVVILDLKLPDIDGFAICQELVDDDETCGIPVIILSGMERPDVIRRSRAAGCQYFVRKPYDPNALLVLIEQCLGDS